MPDLYRPCPAQGCDHEETIPPDADPEGSDDPSYADLWDHVATVHANGSARITGDLMATVQVTDRSAPPAASQRLLCLTCRTTITVQDDTPPLTCCPACGSDGVPADPDDTVTPTITVQELRILTIWASNWANAMKGTPGGERASKVIGGILDGLGQYTAAPLSLTQELSDLRQAVGEVTVYGADGTVTDL